MLLRSSSSSALGSIKPALSDPDSIPGPCKCGQLSRKSSLTEISKSPQNNLTRACRNSVVVAKGGKLPTSVRKNEEVLRSVGVENLSRKGGRPLDLVGNLEFGGGGGVSGGGGSGGGSGGGGGSSGGAADYNSTDVYYQKMLEANPGNPLLLRNYAKFLHEVRRDLTKAEEYYERAILASPGDGDVLSLYAKLIWEVRKDTPRAEAYFDQAVQANPDDCYVLASYAHFLWNSEDDEEEDPASEMQESMGTSVFQKSATAAAV